MRKAEIRQNNGTRNNIMEGTGRRHWCIKVNRHASRHGGIVSGQDDLPLIPPSPTSFLTH
jgi:hypothetical protein